MTMESFREYIYQAYFNYKIDMCEIHRLLIQSYRGDIVQAYNWLLDRENRKEV